MMKFGTGQEAMSSQEQSPIFTDAPETAQGEAAPKTAPPPAQELSPDILEAINAATRPLQTTLQQMADENNQLRNLVRMLSGGPSADGGTHSGTPKGPKVAIPPEYYGRTGKDKDADAMSFEEWSQKVRLYVRMRPHEFPDETTACVWAASRLRGPAESWARPYTKAVLEDTELPPEMTSMEKFLQSLKMAFGRPNEQRSASQELLNLRQGKDTVSDFAIKFRALKSEADFTADDRGWMNIFEKGLSTAFRIDMLSMTFKNTKEFDPWVQELCVKDEELRAQRAGLSRSSWRSHWSDRTHSNASASHSQSRAKDPDAMDIDRMSTDEMMKRGLCFQCGEHGHRARECPQKGKRTMSGRSKVASQTATPTAASNAASATQAATPAASNQPSATLEEVKDESPAVNSVRVPTADDIAKAVAAALKAQGF